MSNKDRGKQISVRVEQPLRSVLEETARREHRTVSDQVRHILATALEQHGEERAA